MISCDSITSSSLGADLPTGQWTRVTRGLAMSDTGRVCWWLVAARDAPAQSVGAAAGSSRITTPHIPAADRPTRTSYGPPYFVGLQ